MTLQKNVDLSKIKFSNLSNSQNEIQFFPLS